MAADGQHPDATALIADAARFLPSQGPIDVFIHHNTLHAFESLPFHDAVAVAHLAIPDLVAVAPYDVRVETGNGPARGRTVCDGIGFRVKRDGRTPNAQVGIALDSDRFEALMLEAFAALP